MALACPASAHELVGDWLIECDNTGACTAVTLADDAVLGIAGSPEDPTVQLALDGPQDAAVHLRLALPAHVTPGRRLRDSFSFHRTSAGQWQLTSADAAAFVQVAPLADRATVGLAVVPLDGLATVLERLPRAEPAPAPPAPPAVTGRFVRADLRDGLFYSALVCGLAVPRDHRHLAIAAMTGGTRIIGVNCGLDGPNAGTQWLVEAVPGQPDAAAFPTPDRPDEPAMAGYLPNSAFDPATGVLTALALGRPQGDCGDWRQWRWTGRGFALIAARRMAVCAGVPQALWPRTWATDPPG